MDDNALRYALKLLAGRDYSRRELGTRLERRFHIEPDQVLDWLEGRGYLDDRRFARSFVSAHRRWARTRMDAELDRRGVGESIRNQVLNDHSWPSVTEAVRDRMARMHIEPPLTPEAAARIARTLSRLGHDPAEIGEELEGLL